MSIQIFVILISLWLSQEISKPGIFSSSSDKIMDSKILESSLYIAYVWWICTVINGSDIPASLIRLRTVKLSWNTLIPILLSHPLPTITLHFFPHLLAAFSSHRVHLWGIFQIIKIHCHSRKQMKLRI